MKANDLASPAARAGLLIASALLLAGCGILPKKEPTDIYEPPRPAAATAEWPQAHWSLLIAKPSAGLLLDSDRIVVRPAGGDITVYKSSSWTDPAPDLVQNALLRRFEDSGKILSVARPGSGVRGDYQLQTELRAFESVYTSAGHPEVQVEIYAKLVHSADGEVAAARAFRETEVPASENLGSVVQAFGAALGRATDQVGAWTLQAGNEHERRPAH